MLQRNGLAPNGNRLHGLGHPEPEWEFILQLLDLLPGTGGIGHVQRVRVCHGTIRNQHGGRVRFLAPHDYGNWPTLPIPIWPLWPLRHALHHGIPRPRSRSPEKRGIPRHRLHDACVGPLLPTNSRNGYLFPRGGTLHPPPADQNRRPRPRPLQHCCHRLRRVNPLHAQPWRLGLGQLRWLFLGRDLLPLHRVYILPRPGT